MRPTHIEHIGIAVRSLAAAVPLFESLLGTSSYAIEEVADQKVRTAFFRVGETKIELLESTSPDGPIAGFLEKRGEGIHHIAFAVKDVGAALSEFERRGIGLIDREPRKGAEGLLIGFLHPTSTAGVLTELCGHPGEGGGEHGDRR
jgi:methylmalonyl-CoA/ethylmalonyl-CoA epimerase